ncbi:MAG: D-glycero-beta-D-manno-heptose-7-phosphate kinase [Candidatus Pacebacteria bacterium]|nr:D-glycero-beta-D-manno-heptose-7-phosphate kinase [Candidatus Paceibacterota bacterium]
MISPTLLDQLQKPQGKIICLGDVMLDRFVYGTVARISPEAPIPVLSMGAESHMLGGSGNVVRNIAALGAGVCFISVVGDDSAGVQVQDLLAAEPLVESHLLTTDSRPTTIKSRFIAQNQQMLRVDSENPHPLPTSLARQVFERAVDALAEQAILVLSDYDKGVLGLKTSAEMIAVALQKNIRVIVDPKGKDYSRYAGASLLTPNRKELAEATALPVATLAEVEAAARHLIARFNFKTILVTLSEEGMLLVPAEDRSHHIPTRARRIYDVSGAGDTVVASLAVALSAGLTLTEAAELANLAAGIVVAKPGTAVCSLDELRTELESISASASASVSAQTIVTAQREFDLTEVTAMVAGWRQAGERIGFTNGCFDVIHGGHVALLAEARSHCDRLIVAVNSDDSVKRLKGESRPLQCQAIRAQVLAAFRAVDAVVIFAEDTPRETIMALRPDLLVKGADYSVDQVVGAREVQSWGGKVVLARLEVGQSTTRIIEKSRGG